jgi:outer membrane protein TolC
MREARIRESVSRLRTEQVRTTELKKQIELDLRIAFDDLLSAEEQIEVAREGLDLSDKELAQARRRYDAGVSYGLEVTDAQTRMERARNNHIEALYNYNLARIELEEALGQVRSRIR